MPTLTATVEALGDTLWAFLMSSGSGAVKLGSGSPKDTAMLIWTIVKLVLTFVEIVEIGNRVNNLGGSYKGIYSDFPSNYEITGWDRYELTLYLWAQSSVGSNIAGLLLAVLIPWIGEDIKRSIKEAKLKAKLKAEEKKKKPATIAPEPSPGGGGETSGSGAGTGSGTGVDLEAPAPPPPQLVPPGQQSEGAESDGEGDMSIPASGADSKSATDPPKLQRTPSNLLAKFNVGDYVEVKDAYQNLHNWPMDEGSHQWRFVIKEIHDTGEDSEEPKATIKRVHRTVQVGQDGEDVETEVAHMNNMGPEINILPSTLSPTRNR